MTTPFPQNVSRGTTFTREGITFIWDGNSWNPYVEEKVNYELFWNRLLTTKFYKLLRYKATENLLVNTIFTEFTCYMINAKSGKADKNLIQTSINQLFLNFDVYHPAQDPDILDNFKTSFEESRMSEEYTYPDKEWVKNHYYDPITNTIAGPQPFPSWELVLAQWEPPFMPPNDGEIYIWNEEKLNWVKSEPPYPSWIVVQGSWSAPSPKPNDGQTYIWNEETLEWISQTPEELDT